MTEEQSDTTVLLDYTQSGDWGEESRRLRQHLAAAQNSDEYNFRRWQDTLAQRDKLAEALKLIEDHHNETEEWRNIAHEALKECGK